MQPSDLIIDIGGEPGTARHSVPLWQVIRTLHEQNGDRDAVLAAFGDQLAPEELDAAVAFYEDNPEAIDARLVPGGEPGEPVSVWQDAPEGSMPEDREGPP